VIGSSFQFCEQKFVNQFPFGYERIQEASWAYLSSLLMIALFFKFNRFWTMRNLDLFFIILLAPGLIMVYSGLSTARQTSNSLSRHATGLEQIGPQQPTREQPDGANPNPAGSTSEGNGSAGENKSESTKINGGQNQGADNSSSAAGTDLPQSSSTGGVQGNNNSTDKSQSSDNTGAGTNAATANTPPVNDGPQSNTTIAPGVSEKTTESSLAPATESTLTGSQRLQRLGYVWLFSVGGVFLVRLLLDPILVRRPLLDPNLSIGGMVFLGCSLMTFMFADIVTAPVKSETGDPRVNGPGYRWLQTLPVIDTSSDRHATGNSASSESSAVKGDQTNVPINGVETTTGGGTNAPSSANETNREDLPAGSKPPASPGTAPTVPAIDWQWEWAAKSLVIANQVAIVLGLIFLGTYHFANFKSGVGMACIYLMVPYTVFYSGHPLHLLPGALMLWAMVAYRRPFWSGLLIGLAAGVAYYPIFLLPLWFSFYWDKGAVRFAIGVVSALALCILGLWFTAIDTGNWLSQLQQMFGFWLPVMEGLRGIWSLGWDANFRLPILVGFLVLAISFVFWPTRKNTGTLIAYSAAIMVAVQFWHGFGGGLYMAWYLPLTLATFFRPNLTDRDAVSQLGDGWLRRFRRTDSKHSALTAA
jgi:hypothetical protein